jgi:uncharacterized protein YjbK
VKEQEALRQILMHLGLKEELATAFCLVFHSLRRRIALMKGSLGISSYSYCNLSWRLEVEVGKNEHGSASIAYFLNQTEQSIKTTISNNNMCVLSWPDAVFAL